MIDRAAAANTTRYLENWQDEIESAFLYRSLAQVEPQPALAEVYRRLAATEETHAQFWEDKLVQIGYRLPCRRIGWRTRTLAWLARRFGSQFVLPTVNAMEQATATATIARLIRITPPCLPKNDRTRGCLRQSVDRARLEWKVACWRS